MPKISERRRAEVRNRILDSARHLVARRGVQGTSMNALVKASGLSKGAIYGHFPSKADLVVALQDRLVESRIEEIVPEGPGDASAHVRLRKLVGALVERSTAPDRERARLDLQFTSSALQSSKLRAQVDARYARVHRRFRELVSEGQRSGEFRAALDPAGIATTIIAVVDGLRVDWAFTSHGRFDSEAILPTLEDLLFEGLLYRREPPTEGQSVRTRGRVRGGRAGPSNMVSRTRGPS